LVARIARQKRHVAVGVVGKVELPKNICGLEAITSGILPSQVLPS